MDATSSDERREDSVGIDDADDDGVDDDAPVDHRINMIVNRTNTL
tara:strand:+ start:204 stop:338 length:135 start_codon:yes stop_codon:yes gene_type:complete